MGKFSWTPFFIVIEFTRLKFDESRVRRKRRRRRLERAAAQGPPPPLKPPPLNLRRVLWHCCLFG